MKTKYLSFDKVKLLLEINDDSLEELICDEKIRPQIRLPEEFTSFPTKSVWDESDIMSESEMELEHELELKLKLAQELNNEEIRHLIEGDFDNLNEPLVEWVYLREPTQVSPILWTFQYASRDPESVKPNTADHQQQSDQWFRRARPLSMADIRTDGGFLISEIESFKNERTTRQDASITISDRVTGEENGDTKQDNYIDPTDYPEELYAAINAYRGVINGYGDQTKTFKERIIDLLRDRHPSLGDEAVNRISILTNNNKRPGRKKRNPK